MVGFAKSNKMTNDSVVFSFFKGLLVAVLLSLGLIILFAFCMKWFEISDYFIAPITLCIKGISLFLGAWIAIKGDRKGLVKGLLFGIIYIVLSFIIFTVLAGQFFVTISTFLDVVFASLLGAIVGIVKVNRR